MTNTTVNALFFISLFLSTVTPFIIGCTADRVPKLVFDKTQHEFIDNIIYNAQEEITTTFSFTNKGNAFLNISKLDADCGCLATKISADKIPPGGTGKIRVKIDRGIGRFLQNIYVYSNAPNAPLVVLQVIGRIVPPISYQREIQFGTVAKGSKTKTKSMTLKNFTDTKVSIISYTTSAPSLHIDIPDKVIPAGGSVNLQPIILIDTVGFYNETFTLHLDSKESPELIIHVKGHGLGAISAIPHQIFLGVLSLPKIERDLNIETASNDPFAITHIKANHFQVSAPLDLQPRVKHKLQLTFSLESSTKGLIEDILRINTNATDVPYIDVPLKAVLP